MISGDRNDIPSYDEDIVLTESVAGGSTSAWHRFLEQYSGLIYHVILRHLPAEDEDDVRSVYVDVLNALYREDLRTYSGRVSLRAWLVLVARRRSVDYIRARYGRRRQPKGFDQLGEFDGNVYQLFFVERLPIEIVIQMLEWNGYSVSIDSLVESIQRIEDTLGQRFLTQLDERYFARQNGLDTAAVLRYVVNTRVEYEVRLKRDMPDQFVVEQETAKQLQRVKELVSQLSEEEQKVVRLRFQEGLSAAEISQRLDMDGPRRVYTVVERVLRRLRTIMNGV
jgi:RNA polymerase sigma factor (sigma-70 family)